MKERIWLGLGIAFVILTFSSILFPALTSTVEAGWFQSGNPVPAISTLSPSGVQAGGPNFTLTVNGTSFISNSVVRWNGADRATTFVSATRLTILVSSSDITATGTVSITVFNPAPNGGESNVASLQINNKMNTTTMILSDDPNPSAQGAAVTVTYAVTATSGMPTGTVTVSDGISSCSGTVASGSCAITLTSAGTRTLTATYSGDSSFNDSAASVSHVVFGPQYFPFIGNAPTPTPTPAPTRTPPPTPTPIPNSIVNGGFEQQATGWYASLQIPYNGPPQGWVLAVSRNDLPSPVSPHSGDWVAWLGGYMNSRTELETANPFTIPPGGSTLRYWLWIQSDEPTCDINSGDGAWVFIVSNTVPQTQIDGYALCQANQTNNSWVKRDVNLAGYAGQSVYLDFVARILGQNSNWFIDDVQMGTLSGASFTPYTRR